MNVLEKEILACLLELESAVKSLPTAHPKPNLLVFFSRLERLASQLPPKSDPSLQHYLQKKSYEKARLLLQDREAGNEAGTSGRQDSASHV